MINKRFLEAKEKTLPEHKIFVAKNLAIIDRIYQILDQKGWTQKKMAQELGKSESEISKWMSGLHNFTLKTISRLEAVLEQEILVTPGSYENKPTVVAHNTAYYTVVKDAVCEIGSPQPTSILNSRY